MGGNWGKTVLTRKFKIVNGEELDTDWANPQTTPQDRHE